MSRDRGPPAGRIARSTPARLVAFDTSTQSLAVALVDGTRLHCVDRVGGPQSSRDLVPTVLQLCAEAGLSRHDLTAIAFGRGPGAFTGLRTACAVAQGLAFGLGCPVLPLDTLRVVAEDSRQRQGSADVWVALDARMNEVYAAHYRHDGDAWQTVVPPALYTLEALAARWQVDHPRAVAGSAIDAFGERLPLPPAVALDPQAAPRAAALAALALAAWSAGQGVAAAEALPLYLRDKVALTTAERLALQAARL